MSETAPAPVAEREGHMTWEEICDHPALQDLPFRIEQDRYGRIIMSPPPGTRHSVLQRRFIQILEEALGGIALPECPIRTAGGTRAADVAWMEWAFAEEHEDASAFSAAPPVCVEVMSKGNTRAEIEEKTALYLAASAQEVWVCERDGRVRFFDHEGERERSALAPDAPTAVAARR